MNGTVDESVCVTSSLCEAQETDDEVAGVTTTRFLRGLLHDAVFTLYSVEQWALER